MPVELLNEIVTPAPPTYAVGICGWCRRDASTLRFVTVPFDAWVCAPCRGVRAGEREG